MRNRKNRVGRIVKEDRKSKDERRRAKTMSERGKSNSPFPLRPSSFVSEARTRVRAIHYAAPESIGDAVALLTQFGAQARVLAGGTDLIVQAREHIRDVDVF